ncbi:MAG TPA: DNA polymerase III subunit delta [Elusimicrobia bacterium]|nr:DNA polymerase III subunit delta [Elusimicrobiota bacterium]
MTINYTQFLQHLKENKISPVYLFSGEENYLKQEALKKIERTLLNAENKELNYNSYSASDIPPKVIIDTLATVPFLAEKRLIVVENIDDWKEKDEQQIINYLDKPSLNSCLVLTNRRVDSKNLLHTKINQVGLIVNCKNLNEGEILFWIRKRFSSEEKTISTPAAQLLLELTGNNLSNLNNEIDKICLYNKEKREINEKIVFSLSAEGRIYQINELAKILYENKLEQTLKILNNLFIENERPEIILGAISRRIRQFIYALSFKEQELSDEEISTKLRIYKSYDPLFFKQVRKFDKKILVRFLEYCQQADYEMKTGKKTAQIALENLIFRLTGTEERIVSMGKT